MRATIQLCTYNRAALLERVLDACFEQTVDPGDYEVVLVNDGSTDATPAVIARAAHARPAASKSSTKSTAALRRAATPASRARAASASSSSTTTCCRCRISSRSICARTRARRRQSCAAARSTLRTSTNLPVPIWSIKDYSGNFFWTTNVSVPLATIRAIGGFNESFSEYGWEDIDVGLRLRAGGVRAVFNPKALVYHYKPRPRSGNVEKMIAQARAQARTAVQLAAIHPHWRTYLATGNQSRAAHAGTGCAAARATKRALRARVGDLSSDRALSNRELGAARALANNAYFEELERTLRRSPS